MKDERVKVILVEPWNDLKLAERVADEAGAPRPSCMASSVGAVKGADSYIAAIDYNVNALGGGAASDAIVLADLLALLWAPFLMCLVLTGIHAYLGVHVLAREVVFVDIALAQIAALGATAAFLFGHELAHLGVVRRSGSSRRSLGALVLALTRSRERHVSQEAVIGVVYAVSSAGAVLLADRAAARRRAHARDARRHPPDRQRRRRRQGRDALRVSIGAAALALPPAVLPDLHRLRAARTREGWRVRLWDFVFYASFGVVVTSSVRIAGVLLVFSYLIVPALAGHARGRVDRHRLLIGWGFGTAGERPRRDRLGVARPADRRDDRLCLRLEPRRPLGRREDRTRLIHSVGVTNRRSARAIVLLAVLLTGCASAQSRAAETAALAGTWRGRMSGPLGNAPVMLTIDANGAFQGLLFVEPTYKEIRGAISVLSAGNIRYEGTNGNGRVTIHEARGERVLRLVPDGGGGGAELTPSR